MNEGEYHFKYDFDFLLIDSSACPIIKAISIEKPNDPFNKCW